MDKGLPTHSTGTPPRFGRHSQPIWRLVALALVVVAGVQWTYLSQSQPDRPAVRVPLHAAEIFERCQQLSVKPGPPQNFNQRTQSDRFVPGTKPMLLKNATIWTGQVEGLEIVKGDILLHNGLIKELGVIEHFDTNEDIEVVDVHGAWITPGVVDLHSHLAVDAAPALRGANDGNSRKGPILPWLRALDALNTHDDAYQLSISGGVTTSLVLPGSANAIGGQGVLIKLRRTEERSPTSLLLENPYSTNITDYDPKKAFRFRQMKHACGENPDRVYSGTRMDTTWAFRQGYNEAREIKQAQDSYCAAVLAGRWEGLSSEFPENYQWEALVDVLRGRVKVHTHCYETVDLDDLVRISNEFQFSIAAFHHAHETYLVPDTLKSAYGHPPAVALFATHARYKREAYRGSEFAPKILADNGLQVVMKSDHPVLNSRYLPYEAQQAHYYGLDWNLALLALTGTPAQVLGQDHRIGYDADIVVWDSHPLALGATPKQVWIDGIPQIAKPHVSKKPPSVQQKPETPNFDKEAQETLEHDGLPPLIPKKSTTHSVVFTNVSDVIIRQSGEIQEVVSAQSNDNIVVVDGGHIVCSGAASACSQSISGDGVEYINLHGGAIAPGLITFGSPLGLEEIQGEPSTSDGYAFDPLYQVVPKVVGGDGAVIRAADGLQFATREAFHAYRHGVTTAIVAPKSAGFLSGISTVFGTGAKHQLERGSIIVETAALHVGIHYGVGPSVSTQIAALRSLLLGHGAGNLAHWFKKVAEGETPLVIDVESADAIATLIHLKGEVEEAVGHPIQFVFAGASEAHLLASEISKSGAGVILTPFHTFPGAWEQRRILAGPPLTEKSAVSTLLEHNVTIALGREIASDSRYTRFDAAWAALEDGGSISRKEAIALVSTNLEKLFGISPKDNADLVATTGGGLFDYSSKVVAIISPRRGLVDII
ncbi:carbohydrate esterase family 9 protein [Irpex rosettiformis]|uniref:Carbohydrate esterase family 9 protein n=1 Tax=Irpex rosettiformis TaxID=378272 RepID=A0ACB8TT05_9APHY|nr:carbohydrate esterase family 9 protein [Irpex rosettiformis]